MKDNEQIARSLRYIVPVLSSYVCDHAAASLRISQTCLILVPRPFPPPVFDNLRYANMVLEGLGDLATWQMADTRRAVPNECPLLYVCMLACLLGSCKF